MTIIVRGIQASFGGRKAHPAIVTATHPDKLSAIRSVLERSATIYSSRPTLTFSFSVYAHLCDAYASAKHFFNIQEQMTS